MCALAVKYTIALSLMGGDHNPIMMSLESI